MRIKKLELIGFKSFKDRTVIHFDAGITGVVGPNGCGKSNIVDGLLWVMGEMSAKDLRGSTMTDVIFAGAEGYAPLGLCEVSLTLENDGGPFPAKYLKFSEIMVTRRLHRSGEGEYFINKEPARLKDIQEIFMDTGAGAKGFSIIQQGMIGRIITAKPEDRKHLIEEAAGITKFKARKKESQRKLLSTEQNILRLQDIIGELKRQIDSLQRQAQKAEKYRQIKQEVEALELWLNSIQYSDLRQAADEASRLFTELQSMEVEQQASLSSLQAEFETLKTELLVKEKAIDDLQNQVQERQSEVQRKEMQLQELRFEIEQARRNEMMTGSLLQEQHARAELLERDEKTLLEQKETLGAEVAELETTFTSKQSTYETSQARINEVDDRLTSGRRDLFALGQTESSLEARELALRSQLDDLNSRLEEHDLALNELREKKQEFESHRHKILNQFERERQLQMDLSNDFESFEHNKKLLGGQIEEKRQEVDTFKDQLNEVASLLYGLENLQTNFEGFEEGVKSVMLWSRARGENQIDSQGNTVQNFYPVSEVVEVPPEYELAMEAALGNRLQMLLTHNDEPSVEAVDYLKNSKVGRSSFLNVDHVQAKHFDRAPSAEAGVITLLNQVVTSPQEFSAPVSQILSGVAIVEDVRTALRLRPEYPGWTFVTPDGDSLSADGVLSGGATEVNAESGLLKRRREIKELSQRKEEWAGKLALGQASLKKIEEQLRNVTNDFEGAQKRKVEQEIKVTELKKDMERSEYELSTVSQSVERQERERVRLAEQKEQLESRILQISDDLVETRTKKMALQETADALTAELTSTRAGFDQLQNDVRENEIQLASKNQEFQGLIRELDRVQRSLGELRGQLTRMSEESEQYSSQMTDGQYKLEEEKLAFEKSVNELETMRRTLAAAKNEYEIHSAQTTEVEANWSKTQRAAHERTSQMTEAHLKMDQATMKEQFLLEQVRERYMLDLSQVYQQHLNREGDPKEGEQTLKELKERLGRMGEVNLSAINEYEETSQRYTFLSQQYNDLVSAKDQLQKVIERINRICSKRFKETFEQVNDRFTKVFPVLFGGGEAHLQLHENEEKGEMGIEMIAKPPGKKMQNVSLMSGGEKALTAVALIFSIFLVKPSPYCLLDEVDAPLDDANVYRFNDLVREMSKRSQIIVVTHNKHTMEVASKLYGVTMQERGVSTMVSVNLQEAQLG
ncbi:MAG: chromosome segregation protein SMC [Bdellovibrionota bacterium]